MIRYERKGGGPPALSRPHQVACGAWGAKRRSPSPRSVVGGLRRAAAAGSGIGRGGTALGLRGLAGGVAVLLSVSACSSAPVAARPAALDGTAIVAAAAPAPSAVAPR